MDNDSFNKEGFFGYWRSVVARVWTMVTVGVGFEDRFIKMRMEVDDLDYDRFTLAAIRVEILCFVVLEVALSYTSGGEIEGSHTVSIKSGLISTIVFMIFYGMLNIYRSAI